MKKNILFILLFLFAGINDADASQNRKPSGELWVPDKGSTVRYPYRETAKVSPPISTAAYTVPDLNPSRLHGGHLTDEVSERTGTGFKYRRTESWYDGTAMTDEKTDGVVYKKTAGVYYEMVFENEVNVMLFGAKGDGVTDDSGAFQKCIDYSSAKGKKMYVPKTATFYNLDCRQLMGDEFSGMAPVVRVALEMRSNLHMVSNKAVLKIKGGISSRAKPTPMRMFFSNNFLENISFDGLILDMNGANNLLSPGLPLISNNYTQAHILFSGTKAGIAAGANNVLIENCEFLNTAGVTCIGMAQSNTEGVTLGSNWVIRNSRFYNNGFDSVDHSSIYAFANDVECYGNTFDNPSMFKTVGGLVAIEVHGSNTRIHNNVINNYFQGIWVAINWSQPLIDNTEIYSNTAKVSGVFVDFYNGNLEKPPFYPISITNTRIYNNSVTVTNDPVPDALKQFVRIGSKIHPVNTSITGNKVVSESTSKNVSFVSVIVFPDQVRGLDNLLISDNTAAGLGDGILFFWNKNTDLNKIQITNNNFGRYLPLKDAHNADILGYGHTLGSVKDMTVKNQSLIRSDNEKRFIVNGISR